MLTTFFVALLHLALLLGAGGHLQHRAAQNWNDTALLRKRSNLTDVVFDKRALVARNPTLSQLFGGRPAHPPSHHVLHQPVELSTEHRTYWTALMDIGTPARRIKVILDTDSSCFWVHSPTKSSTVTSAEMMRYDGRRCHVRYPDLPRHQDIVVNGDLYMDQMRIGGVQERAMVMYVSHLTSTESDGVLGLSFAHESSDKLPKEMAFITNVLGKKFPHPVFALCFVGRAELHFGAPRPAYYDESTIEYHDVTKPSTPYVRQRWQIGSAVIGINRNEKLIPKFETVFDTTAVHIIAPYNTVKNIYKVLQEGENRYIPEGANMFPCHKKIELYLRWNNGRAWTISKNTFDRGPVAGFEGMCEGLIRSGGDDDIWILGNEFISDLYLVFNATLGHPQMALALAHPHGPSPGNGPHPAHGPPPAYGPHLGPAPPAYGPHLAQPPPAHGPPPAYEDPLARPPPAHRPPPARPPPAHPLQHMAPLARPPAHGGPPPA
ncbi:hypothetical protein APHAL10511_004664 [Amanita phalloides]|nr:hypothetical protein APHAL10511_004664 [Amanita phalloides]